MQWHVRSGTGDAGKARPAMQMALCFGYGANLTDFEGKVPNIRAKSQIACGSDAVRLSNDVAFPSVAMLLRAWQI